MSNTAKVGAARAGWLITTLLATTAFARSGSVGGTELEARDLAAASPRAASLVAQAAEAVRVGAPRQAWNLFSEAWGLAPRSAVPARGICRLALALGIRTREERAAAGEACGRAVLLAGTPEDIRNQVAALIDGEPLPSMADLVAASVAAEGAARTGPEQPWGPAARGDLALRLGDRELLDAALVELRRVAPDHPETRRLAALASPPSSRGVWVGRAMVLLLLVLTVGHAARGWLGRRRRSIWRATRLAGLLLLLARTAAAQPASPAIDDAHPERSVPTPAQQMADPLKFGDLITELGLRADAATARHDHAAAARYYLALAKAVPDRSYAFTKLCEQLEASGRRAEAIAACGAAVSRRGATALDVTRYRELRAVPPNESRVRRWIRGVRWGIDAAVLFVLLVGGGIWVARRSARIGRRAVSLGGGGT